MNNVVKAGLWRLKACVSVFWGGLDNIKGKQFFFQSSFDLSSGNLLASPPQVN